jgi:hypothetical protein
MAEDAGFEPARSCPLHAFQACALGHYANPPPSRLSRTDGGRVPDGGQRGSAQGDAILRIADARCRRPPLHSGADPSRGVHPTNPPRAGRQQG